MLIVNQFDDVKYYRVKDNVLVICPGKSMSIVSYKEWVRYMFVYATGQHSSMSIMAYDWHIVAWDRLEKEMIDIAYKLILEQKLEPFYK